MSTTTPTPSQESSLTDHASATKVEALQPASTLPKRGRKRPQPLPKEASLTDRQIADLIQQVKAQVFDELEEQGVTAPALRDAVKEDFEETLRVNLDAVADDIDSGRARATKLSQEQLDQLKDEIYISCMAEVGIRIHEEVRQATPKPVPDPAASKVADIPMATASATSLPHIAVPVRKPPAAPDLAVYHGLAGQLVHAIEPHSEADPLGLLIQTLVAFGSSIGRTAHFRVESDLHYLNLFTVLVGTTSKGRKGTSWGHIRRFFELVDKDWADQHILSGIISGPGLIAAVGDPIDRQDPVKKAGHVVGYTTVRVFEGVKDKRLLCLESEFASVLKVASWDGSTVSTTIRQAWDTGTLATMAKNSPMRATGAHISLIGHGTDQELRRYLSVTEQANGFGNRILWATVKQSQLLPEGGDFKVENLADLHSQFAHALAEAKHVGEMGFDQAARTLWKHEYERLSKGRPGLAGAMTARAEAQVRRLACLYALLDLKACVEELHLRSGLALWDYCQASVDFIFGDSLGDSTADDILLMLQSNANGLTRTQLRDHFHRHKSSAEIARALGVLKDYRLAHDVTLTETGGSNAELWKKGPAPAP